MRGAGNARLLGAGAIGSAIAASVCCIGPLVLAILGLGGGALLLQFESYRPYFLGATALLLGAAFYLTYRRRQPESCPTDSACSAAENRGRQKLILWIVTVIVGLVASFPVYSKILF